MSGSAESEQSEGFTPPAQDATQEAPYWAPTKAPMAKSWSSNRPEPASSRPGGTASAGFNQSCAAMARLIKTQECHSSPRTSVQTKRSSCLKAAASLLLGAARATQQSMLLPLQQQVRQRSASETVDSWTPVKSLQPSPHHPIGNRSVNGQSCIMRSHFIHWRVTLYSVSANGCA